MNTKTEMKNTLEGVNCRLEDKVAKKKKNQNSKMKKKILISKNW